MNAEDVSQNKEKKSFWNTTIGIITKITAFLSAITALIIAYNNFSNTVSPGVRSPSSVTAPPVDNTSPNPNDPNPDDKPAVPVDSGTTTPVEKKPDIRISAFSVDPSEITLDEDAKPKTFTATLEAVNTGNGLAENCFFTLLTDKGTIGDASSASFSLDPETKKEVVITATISNSGKITAKLSCSNDAEKLSDPKDITVYAYGTIHHIIPKN